MSGDSPSDIALWISGTFLTNVTLERSTIRPVDAVGEALLSGDSGVDADPRGCGAFDSCHFDGSNFEKAVTLSGGTWTVEADNSWGIDSVGWRPDVALYYQQERSRLGLPFPCESSTPQEMTISCSGGAEPVYVRHELRTIIEKFRLGVQKGTVTVWQVWP